MIPTAKVKSYVMREAKPLTDADRKKLLRMGAGPVNDERGREILTSAARAAKNTALKKSAKKTASKAVQKGSTPKSSGLVQKGSTPKATPVPELTGKTTKKKIRKA